MSNGDQFCIEPTAPSGGGGAPSAHADSHKAGGSDPLLASPGAIGGGTANTIRGTTITATSGFVGDGSQLTNLPGGGLFVSPIALGTGAWALIAGGYSWGTSWTVLKDTTIVNIRAYTAETSGTFRLKLWVGGVAVASGTVTITAAGIYTLATPFSYVVPARTTFTVSAYPDVGGSVGTAGIPYITNNYTSTSYPILGAATLMLANPRLYDGSGSPLEPTSTSSNYIFGVEPVVGS